MEHQFYGIRKGHGGVNTTSLLLCDKRAWIATAVGLAGSAISSIFGGAKASKARKKAMEEQKYRSNAEKAWYDKSYNTDYIDTKAGSNLLRRAQEVQDEYVRKADGAAAVGGGTAASVAQAKEAANRTVGDAIANTGAKDADNKRAIDKQHLDNMTQQSREREQYEQQRASDITTAAQGASNAIMTAAGSLDNSANSPKTNTLAKSQTLSDNIKRASEDISHLSNKQGFLNPVAGNAHDLLDNSALGTIKKKPNIAHIDV